MKNSSKYTAVIVRIERRLYKKKKSCMYRYKYVWKVDKIIAPRENNRKTTLYPALTEARMLQSCKNGQTEVHERIMLFLISSQTSKICLYPFFCIKPPKKYRLRKKMFKKEGEHKEKLTGNVGRRRRSADENTASASSQNFYYSENTIAWL